MVALALPTKSFAHNIYICIVTAKLIIKVIVHSANCFI